MKAGAKIFFWELFIASIAKTRVHYLEKPILLASLAGNASEVTCLGVFASGTAAGEAVCDFFASSIDGRFGSSIFGFSDFAVPGGLVPRGIPVIPFSRRPRVRRAMTVAILAPVPVAFGGGLVECFVGFVALGHAEVFVAIVSKVDARHRRGRRARAVVAKESGTVDACLKGAIARPPAKPNACTAPHPAKLPVPAWLR